MPRSPLFLEHLLAVALLITPDCGGHAKKRPATDWSQAQVETEVSRNEIGLGEAFAVTCRVTDKTGQPLAADTDYEIRPDTWTQQDGSVVPALAGFYEVTCSASNPQDAAMARLRDATPETVLVRAVAGDITVETRLSEDSAPAGDPVTVMCEVRDQDGHLVEADTDILVEPAEGIERTGFQVTGQRMGIYRIRCRLSDDSQMDPTPAPLTVIAGPPTRVTTTLEPAQVGAGEWSDVDCSIYDAFDNPVSDAPTTVTGADGLTIDDHAVSAQQAGTYAVGCRLNDEPKPGILYEDATLTVGAGQPVRVELTAMPERTHYAVNATITLVVNIYDAADNILDGIPYTLTIPDGVQSLPTEKAKFTTEGRFTFVVALDAPHDMLQAEMTLVCDGSPPEIVLLQPPRGSTFDQADVDVVGEVRDASDVDWVYVNDEPIPVDQDGRFATVLHSDYGLTVVEARAADEWGQGARTTASYYFSSQWIAPPDDPPDMDAARIPDSLEVYLGQQALDDGEHDPANIDDIATLIEILLGSLDLNSLIGQAPVFEQTFDNVIDLVLLDIGLLNTQVVLTGDVHVAATIADFQLGQPAVSLLYHEGGMDLALAFVGATPEAPGLDATLHLALGLDLSLAFVRSNTGEVVAEVTLDPSVETTSSAGLHEVGLHASFDLWLDTEGQLHVDVLDIAPDMAGFDIDLLEELTIHLGTLDVPGIGAVQLPDLPLTNLVSGINDFVGGLIDGALDWIADGLFDLLSPFVSDAVTALLEQVLNSLVIDLPLTLPQLPGSDHAVELRFSTELSSLALHPEGGTFGLGSALVSQKAVDRDPLGSILRADCLGFDPSGVTFDPATPMQLGLAHDFVNELIFALWWGGGLNLTLDQDALGGAIGGDIPINGLNVTLDWLLPPILTDCTSKGFLQLQLGDLFADVTARIIGNVHAQLYVSGRIEVELHASGDTLGMTVLAIPELVTDFVYITPGMESWQSMIEGLIRGFLPQIVDGLSDALGSIPLPAIDLSTVVPGVPPGTSLRLGNLLLTDQRGFVLIGGELLGNQSAPAP